MNLKDWDPGVKGVYHPFNFRGWWDFGTGLIGDLGCHKLSTVFKALQLGHPSSIEASTTKPSLETYPLGEIIRYEFPARGDLPPHQPRVPRSRDCPAG